MNLPKSTPLARARAWIARHFDRRVAVATASTVLALLLVANGAAYLVTRSVLARAVAQKLEVVGEAEALRIGYPLSALVDNLATLARSRLLSNALVDSVGRAQYVAPFLRDVQATPAFRVDLTLGDFRGSAIASSSTDAGHGFIGAPWVGKVVGEGRSHAELGTPHGDTWELLLAVPVLYQETRTTEGMLIAEVKLKDILASAPPTSPGDVGRRIVDASGRVLASDGGDWADMITLSVPLSSRRELIPLGMSLQVGTPRSVAFAPLRTLALVYAVGTGIAFMAVLLVTALLARWISRPVRNLAMEATRIAGSGRLDESVAVEGADEVAQLARAFNDMLRALQRATEAQLAALQARNEELVRMHEESRRLEMELRQAQKLEAVGRLAAGIAHEINTPIQYIGDNTYFMADACKAFTEMLDEQRAALQQVATPETLARLDRLAEKLDLAYARANAPGTIERTLEGTRRVATIIRSMKEFAYPDQKEMTPTDVNRALLATLDVARNEIKYVADVETSLGNIPAVDCHAGSMNQVWLNLLVNAAHAIEEVVKSSGGKGRIRVETVRDGEYVVVSISDTGTGIPEEIRDKVFEPFFTTKPVGSGTGQGLAIARNIVERHGGSIAFETEVGKGTTFRVRLPIRGDGPRPRLTPAPRGAGGE